MIQITFHYKGNTINIQSTLKEKIGKIFDKFLDKLEIKNKQLYYIYQANMIDNECDLSLEKMIGQEDKKSNQMNIIVNEIEDLNKNDNIIKSKFIICPNCKEKTCIKIRDYKVELYNCKNKHRINDIVLDKYEQIQNIDISKIVCYDCKENKSNIHNKEFFKCITCQINLCPLCKTNHNKEHNIINYDSKDIICSIHKEVFISYCNECKTNICLSCINKHKDHDCISFMDIIPDLDKMKEEKKILRTLMDKLKENINDIIKKLNEVGKNMEIYYKIYDDMLNNYQNKNRNYELIKSINEIDNINILKDLNEINKFDNIIDKCINILNIYNKMTNNKLNINQEKIYNNGLYYGTLKNGLREGKGIMYFNTDDRYEGEWKNDKFEGKGIYYYYDGDKYEGEWKNNSKEGKGTYYFTNGNRYEGEWKNDKREGKGIYYWNDGGRYEGDWKNSKRDGKGILYFNHGQRKGDRYEGDFKNDKKEGKGIYYYNSGDTYEGDFKKDKKEGKGIYYYKNGDREMGDYLLGKEIGKHAILHLNGNITTKNY